MPASKTSAPQNVWIWTLRIALVATGATVAIIGAIQSEKETVTSGIILAALAAAKGGAL